MVNKSKKKTKNIIIGICAAIVVIAITVVGIVMAIKNNGSGLNENFFKSDDTKYVLAIDADDMSFDEDQFHPIKVYFVYNYSGDDVTGLKGYYEFEDAGQAEAAYNYLLENQSEGYKSVSVDGKYVVLEAEESEYADLSANDVKQQIEYMDMMKALGPDGYEAMENASGSESTTENVEEE